MSNKSNISRSSTKFLSTTYLWASIFSHRFCWVRDIGRRVAEESMSVLWFFISPFPFDYQRLMVFQLQIGKTAGIWKKKFPFLTTWYGIITKRRFYKNFCFCFRCIFLIFLNKIFVKTSSITSDLQFKRIILLYLSKIQ